ncbi:SCO7613 C-terminal domain-containing membrane protein [Agromyces sp. MMS24-K17]|uniref:SCO7613 C-terminal domain-containing membrane protein n=1 Tax=Agromyces sp. MMS24-K17 TaxID=3372850 RepID=UPI0037542F59
MTDRPPSPDVAAWPSDPAWLLDTTRCPSCFTVLVATRCHVCGLDLTASGGERVLEAARAMHGWESARRSRLAQMRVEQAAREAEAVRLAAEAARAAEPVLVAEAGQVTAEAPPQALAAVAPAEPAGPSVVSVPPGIEPPRSGTAGIAAAPPSAPRRSGVQIALLTVGVVLVSVAAIVFLLVAYLIASLEVRSVIIALASALVLGVAVLLRRRRLPGTAEGVASVAVVLLLLDAWIVRANGLFGSDDADPLWYTAIAFAAVAAVLALVRLGSGLRVPGFAAAVLGPTAAFLVGLAVDPWTATGAWLGGLLAAVLGVGIARRGATPEHLTLRGAGFGGLGLAALFAGWALPDAAAGTLWAYLAVAAVGLGAALATATDELRGWSAAAAAIAGAAAALAPLTAIVIDAPVDLGWWLGPALAGAVVVLAGAVHRRSAGPAPLAAVVAAGAVAAAGALPALVSGIGWVSARAVGAMGAWAVPADAPLTVELESIAGLRPVAPWAAALCALGLALGALALGAVLGRPVVRRRLATAALALGGAAALFAGAAVPMLWLAVAAFLLIAAAALVIAARGVLRAVGGAVPILAVTGILAALTSLGLGRAAEATWPVAVAVVTALALVARAWSDRLWGFAASVPAGATHLGLASALVAVFGWTIPGWLARSASFAQPFDDGWTWVALLAAPLLVLVLLLPRLHDADRAAAGLPLLAAGAIGSGTVALDGGPGGWIPAALLAAVAAGTIRLARPPLVGFVLAAVAPLGLAVAASAIDAVDPDLRATLLAGAALVAAALAHPLLRGLAPALRRTWIVATLVTGLWALVAAFAAPSWTWLVLLLLAPVPVVCAALEGDPIGGRSPWRHLSWAALPLATGAVWAWLADHEVDAVEPYTLPLAGFLLATAALIVWRRPTGEGIAPGRTAVVAAALGVAVLPVAALAGDSDLRTIVLVAIGAVAALAAIGLPSAWAGLPVRLLVVVAAWAALVLPSVLRGATVVGDFSPLPVEFWPAIGFAGALLLAVPWHRDGERPAALGSWIVAASLTLAAVPTAIAIAIGDLVDLRAAVLVTLLMAAHVASATRRAGPFAGPLVGWVSLADAVLVAGVALLSPVDQVESVSIPLGAGLVVAGAIRMARTPSLGSWPALAPGLGVLFVPTFIAGVVDPQWWRIIGLAAAALATLLIGLRLRLQAPFVLGTITLLVHGVVQLWPWISWLYEAVWWWLWLGVAGALLITLAATYERQLRLAKGVARSIGELR